MNLPIDTSVSMMRAIYTLIHDRRQAARELAGRYVSDYIAKGEFALAQALAEQARLIDNRYAELRTIFQATGKQPPGDDPFDLPSANKLEELAGSLVWFSLLKLTANPVSRWLHGPEGNQ